MGKPIIKIKDLCYSYNGTDQILNNVNLTINAGEFVALVGQNGAGKTTLVKHLNGLLKPTAGQVIIGDIDVTSSKTSVLARQVGFVFQNPDHQIFHDRVEKEVAFGLKNIGLAASEIATRVTNALESVGLLAEGQTYPFDLSRGQRQRVALASVLAMRPPVIVLDEPTTGQDYRESTQIMEIVRQLNLAGHTIIIITHDMSLVAQYAQRIIALCGGEVLIDGSVQQAFAQPQLLAQTLLELPPIVRLAQGLAGGLENLLTVEQVSTALNSRRGEHNGLSN
ncbi:ABC transporter ATP-binding protein [Peptococcaceae bacterium 1198_IL3148]